MASTLQFQCSSGILVHGDINEGNILYDSTGRVGCRLALIDWDEALRGRPCHRQISNEEEKLRYSMELVTFPSQYTKQQLLHLSQTLIRKHYQDHLGSKAILDEVLTDKQGENANRRGFLSRESVDARFKALLHCLCQPAQDTKDSH